MHRVFIDGQAGTTGLEIAARLRARGDLALLEIDDATRKDRTARAALFNQADLVVLCLPDDAAREAVTLIDNPRTRILDASTAFRTAPDWVYGLPELDATQRERIGHATRVSNPGCYPTGFILTVRPLIDAGLLSPDVALSVHAVSGYSGGGRLMVERYQAHAAAHDTAMPPKSYGLGLNHKHVPEMTRYSGLSLAPIFAPAVADYYKGMLVHVPLDARLLRNHAGAAQVHEVLSKRYRDEACIRVWPLGATEALDDGFLNPTAANDTNRIDLMVFGNSAQTLVVSRYDNLGKGASGAAVQNLNLMLGLRELEGLTL